MKTKISLITIIFIISVFLITSCGKSNYTTMSNYTITSIEVTNSEILIEGRLHGSLIVVNDYSCRTEGDAMYIKVYLSNAKSSEKKVREEQNTSSEFNDIDARKHLSIYFGQPLPNNIEKIFIEDEKDKIMIWDKSQGYDKFEIENTWKTELKKLKEQK